MTEDAPSDGALESDRSIELEPDAADGSTPSEADGIDRTGPLSDLAAAVDERRDAAGDDDAEIDFDELFDREDATALDRDRLWERLENDDAPGAPPRDEERTIREIETDGYCHRCEHFASPPTVACTREGTDILEMPVLGRFRVADCPVVLEDKALEGRE
ncbi:hypothetical protein C477_13545 [Haloterrigena salina JCM 13891]|uniref:DUF8135 domain-containing protein n=1 Tax=Haloterrigena salina JCM 13891 TaxID=1227488 RepID=M0C3L0_9EURY|nr:hypothetical protein [Haloterrigena salina]ELZ17258.1 hypothetical protein C477_13545 [Haloterrigena salina JCM 13891]